MSAGNPRLPDPKRSGLLGAVAIVLLGIFFYLPTWHGLYRLSYDLPFSLAPGKAPPQAVIVFMDDESRGKLEESLTNTWDRRTHAQLVRILTEQHAKVIALDVLMDQTNGTAEADRELGEAIAAHGKVLLAEDVEVSINRVHDSEVIAPSTKRPVEALSGAASGAVNFPKDQDGIVRRQYWNTKFTNSFALAAAHLAGVYPPKQTRQRWLNYYGPKGTIDNRPYIQALSNNVPAQFFSNRVVFVGKKPVITRSGTSEDEHPTPLGAIGGVEIQATAFLNLVNKEWLTELPQGAMFLLLLGIGVASGYGLVFLRPWVALRWATGGMVLITIAGFVLPKFHYWFAWLIPVVLQIPLGLILSVIGNSRRLYVEKTLLEETLATGHGAVRSRSEVAPFAPATQTPLLNGASDPEAATLATPLSSAPVVPDITLIRNVGQGAYGEVWLGRDILGTYKAVKIVYRDRFSSPGPFDREFRGLQKFTPISRSHPGFVHILHVGRNDQAGYFYAIMEIGDDETNCQKIDPNTYTPRNLSKVVKRAGKLPVTECLKLAVALADALDFLHKQRLIHRDVKPSNIIFVNGHPKFADIGLVTDLAERGGDVTYLGTEGFIAPEGPGTAAADVYSLGKVLYEASMGRDRDFFPELPTTLTGRADRRELLQLNDIILKACEVEVEQRYQTAAELKIDLLALQTRIT